MSDLGSAVALIAEKSVAGDKAESERCRGLEADFAGRDEDLRKASEAPLG